MQIYRNYDEEPVESSRSLSVAANIPQFTLPGALRVGSSPHWTPIHNIILTKGYVQTRTTGSSVAGFVFMKVDLAESSDPIILGAVSLAANKSRAIFEFEPPENAGTADITPLDRIYVNVLAASGHEDTVIQFAGYRY